MPNYCSNDIAITGPKEDIDALEALLKTEEVAFDFNLFIPYPKQFKDADDEARKVHAELAKEAGDPYRVDWSKVPKDGFNSGGYEWCIENWGTKWNALDAQADRVDENNFSVWFDTAWSPPIPIIHAMSEKFPTLEITMHYEEGGMDFAGYTTFLAGEEIDGEDGPYYAEGEGVFGEEEGFFSSLGSAIDLRLTEE